MDNSVIDHKLTIAPNLHIHTHTHTYISKLGACDII